jgi:hypothetical protein
MVFLDDSENMAGSSLIIPYYRVYFGKEKAAGFFIEGNMAMLRLRETDLYGDLYSSDSGFFHSHSSATYNSYFGFGAAVGVKLLTKNNLVGELVFGIGRLYNRYDDGAYPRIGLCLGKRF